VTPLPNLSIQTLDPLGFSVDGAVQRNRVLAWFELSTEALEKAVEGTRACWDDSMTTDQFILQLAYLANSVALGWVCDASKAARWFRAHNPMLGGPSPMEMIEKGRIHRLQLWIESTLQAFSEYPSRPPQAES